MPSIWTGPQFCHFLLNVKVSQWQKILWEQNAIQTVNFLCRLWKSPSKCPLHLMSRSLVKRGKGPEKSIKDPSPPLSVLCHKVVQKGQHLKLRDFDKLSLSCH